MSNLLGAETLSGRMPVKLTEQKLSGKPTGERFFQNYISLNLKNKTHHSMKTNLFLPIISLFACIVNSNAQNLVANESFEVQVICPAAGQIVNAQPWDSPTSFSGDLMNDTCPIQNMPGRTGHGCAGIYIYNGVPDQRQYIQGKLSSALLAGEQYNVSFWVFRTNNHWASNRMGAYLSVGAVSQPIFTNLSFTPQLDNPANHPLNSPNWELLSGTFVAAGGEDNIIIGSFYPDVQTTLYIANASSSNYTAYYLVDDVSVYSLSTGIPVRQFSASDVNVFPQPAAGSVVVKWPAGLQVDRLRLSDISGNEIILQEGISNPVETSLVIDKLLPGIYILTLESGQSVINKKIVLIE